MKHSKIDDLVRGRSVALVGNATGRYVAGPPIDESDCVVRLNRGPFAANASLGHGLRTDIAMFSGQPRTTIADLDRVASVLVRLSIRRRLGFYRVDRDIRKSIEVLSKRDWLQLRRELGAVPSSGVMGIHFLLKHEPLELRVYGMNWWTSATTYTGRISLGPHNPSAEQRWVESKASEGHLSVCMKLHHCLMLVTAQMDSPM